MTGASGFVCLDLDDCFVGLLSFVKNSSIYAPVRKFISEKLKFCLLIKVFEGKTSHIHQCLVRVKCLIP